MASHFASIGLTVPDAPAFERLLAKLFETAVEAGPSTRKHRHLHWRDASGAAVAFHVDAEGRVERGAPFFVPAEGSARWRVRTREPAMDPGCVHCSGVCCDILGGNGDMVTRAGVQFVDFLAYQSWLKTEQEYDLEVTAFAHSAMFFEDEKAFDAGQQAALGTANDPKTLGPEGKPLTLAPNAFLPGGLFAGEKAPMSERARVLFAGEVKSSRELRNTTTDATFHHMRVATLPGPTDVVIESGLAQGPAVPGSIALIEAWLIGRPAVPPPPPGVWRRCCPDAMRGSGFSRATRAACCPPAC